MSQTDSGCPECSGRLRTEGGETVCGSCGLVVAEDRIDPGPEWRRFGDGDRSRERTGAPLTRARHDRGLSTEIGRATRLKGRKRRQVARMRRQHRRAQLSGKRERNLVYAFVEVRRLAGALSLPDRLRDDACSLVRRAQRADLMPGRSLEGFAAAAVYAACRMARVTRTTDEVLADARATEAEYRVAYDAMSRGLDLAIPPAEPAEFLPRFASKLDLPPETERRARKLAAVAAESGTVVGRNPGGVAAACLYLAAREAGDPVRQTDAAAAADVSPATLRAVSRRLDPE